MSLPSCRSPFRLDRGINRLRDLDVLHRYAGQIGDGDFVVVLATRNIAVDDGALLCDLAFGDKALRQRMMDISTRLTLRKAVGDDSVDLCEDIGSNLVFLRGVGTDRRNVRSRPDVARG